MIKIAVDAMGGDNSPEKVMNGIIHHYSSNKNVFYKIFGDEKKIIKFLDNKIDNKNFEIHNTLNKVSSEDSPLEAAKRGKDTSMWLAIESVKNKDCDIVHSSWVDSSNFDKYALPTFTKKIFNSLDNYL